jgi:hypothetical protein
MGRSSRTKPEYSGDGGAEAPSPSVADNGVQHYGEYENGANGANGGGDKQPLVQRSERVTGVRLWAQQVRPAARGAGAGGPPPRRTRAGATQVAGLRLSAGRMHAHAAPHLTPPPHALPPSLPPSRSWRRCW